MSHQTAQTTVEMQLQIEMEESKTDFNNLDDIFKFTCSFDKLQLILRMLLNS